MPKLTDFRIAVFPGDGIGAEITAPTLRLLENAAARAGGFSITPQHCPAGAAHYRETGSALPEASLATARRADAILLAAMGLPDVRYPDGTEVSPQLDLRFELGLYAGVRPIRAIPGVPVALADPRAQDIDLVILRESTEGLFASHGRGEVTPDRATETLVLTRATTERLHDFGLRLAAQRREAGGRGRATCVDKANVFRAFAWFRSIFDDRARAFPGLTADHMYIDACALNMVTRPWELDVLITENMFGDILSDLGAGLIGGMGYAPSADIGDAHAVFQPCHGSAPDIAGKGLANPTAMILSGAMMLEWLGREKGVAEAGRAGALIRGAVDAAFAGGNLRTAELGGRAGTAEVFAAVEAALGRVEV
ncbi:MAG TPA: isocitrate/isopropylmalate family dehydrogenase [Thermohalobaculum sp.]|nr:isocitrate/isopropylmalate family dehydrogenase [Thermohalobaculum sp.]